MDVVGSDRSVEKCFGSRANAPTDHYYRLVNIYTHAISFARPTKPKLNRRGPSATLFLNGSLHLINAGIVAKKANSHSLIFIPFVFIFISLVCLLNSPIRPMG